jgi:aminopeptidase YwaD
VKANFQRWATVVMVAGLLGGCATEVPSEAAQRVRATVSEARLREDVATLTRIGSSITARREGATRRIGPGNLQAQREKLAFLRSQLEPLGYAIELETFDLPERFRTAPNVKGINLLATKRGTTQPERVIELGAHYDTMATPGADDNSSGVAGALEVARVLAAVPTAKSVRFCFFDLEELGLLGSTEHVRRIAGQAATFEGIIVLEMIGYAVDGPDTQRTPVRVPGLVSPPTTGNFIAVLGDLKSGGLGNAFERAADAGAPPLPYFSLNRLAGLIKDAARSDQYPYWEAGLPGIMITDTANFRNPHYHRVTDTIETLNFAFMAQVTRATAICLLERAGTN